MRGRAKIQEMKNGRDAIVVTEVPYQMNKKDFVEKVADLVIEKIIVGISEIRDESNKDGVRVVFELKRDAFPKKIISSTSLLLQTSFSYNMIATERTATSTLQSERNARGVSGSSRRSHRTTYSIWFLAIAEARAHILEL